VAGKFGGFLSASIVFAVMIGFVLVIAACSSDPTPTPTVAAPTPTATSVPTVAPTTVPATATSTPIPATATPTSVPIPVDQLVITETSTVRDLMSPLSGDEIACVRETIGPEIFDTIQDIPLPSLPSDAGELPWECMSPEKAIGLNVAIISATAGGLSAETRSCITGVAVANPSALGIGAPPESFGELISGAIRVQLCLTDEEAAAFAASQGAALPSPSALQCLEEQLGGEEALLAMLADEAQAEMAMQNLFSAALACEPGQMEGTPTAG
jgi:hypothetical protein